MSTGAPSADGGAKPLPLGERNALLIRSVKSAFVLLSTKVTKPLNRGSEDFNMKHVQNAMTNRQLYSSYKTAATPEKQEKARQEYLDRRGYFPSFRW